MSSEIITKKQFIAITTAFLMGSSLILGTGGAAKKDAWIAVACAMLITVPVYFIYGRIVSLFPDKGLYDIITIVFGNILGGIIILLFAGFSFILGALVIRDFTEFIKSVTLHDTPLYVVGYFITVLSIWAVKSGVEVIGRWTAVMLPIILLTIVVVTFLFIPIVDFQNIMPILYNGVKPVLNATFSAFSFPFGEAVVLLFMFSNLKKGSSPYKVLFWGLLLGGGSLLLATLRSLIVLGEANTNIFYFASYTSARLINIGDFLERMEIIIATNFVLSGFIKISICLLAACSGTAKALKIPEYRRIVAPIGLMMMIFSIILFSNTRELFEWSEKYYQYYALPYEVIFPLIIWIGAEIKARKLGNIEKAEG